MQIEIKRVFLASLILALAAVLSTSSMASHQKAEAQGTQFYSFWGASVEVRSIKDKPKAITTLETITGCNQTGAYPISGTAYNWTGSGPVSIQGSYIADLLNGGHWYLKVQVTGPGTFIPYLTCGIGEQLPG